MSLHSHHIIDPDIRLIRVNDAGERTDIMSGYIREYQPARRLVTPQVIFIFVDYCEFTENIIGRV